MSVMSYICDAQEEKEFIFLWGGGGGGGIYGKEFN